MHWGRTACSCSTPEARRLNGCPCGQRASRFTRSLECRDNRRQPSSGARVKTYDIEVQRLKSMKHDKGLVEIGLDALVLARPVRDEASSASSL